MGEFFGSIYCWFEDFFGIELANYLWGISTTNQETNMFIGIGLSMTGISLAIALIYYYVIDHPRLNRWWGWGIFLLINCVVNFLVGWQWVLSHYVQDKMFYIDPVTNMETPLNIYKSDIVCFGVSNMLLSILAFLIISCIIKWRSKNCPYSPF